MTTKPKLSLNLNEKGFASLIIAAILVVVLGLLTVGFAELMRHSQQQELNRHLSDQAYYAAESGVNDAVRALNNGYSETKTDCGPTTDPTAPEYSKYLADNKVDTGSDSVTAEWSCLLINPTPSSLQFNPVDTVTPKAFIVEPVNSNNGNPTSISQLTVYWQDADKSNKNFRSTCGGNNCFPAASSWNAIGMLRFSITPLTVMNRDALTRDTYTAFLYPSTGGPSTGQYGGNTGFSAGNGPIINGSCNSNGTPLYCHVNITNLPNSREFLISLRSIYSKTNVQMESPGVSFAGAQTLVDSTGKSKNILRRIQVRVPDKNNFPYPGFNAEATGGICKTISALPSGVSGC